MRAIQDTAIPNGRPVRVSGSSWFGWTNPVQEYWVDACQRGLLTLDALRERGNNYLEQKKLISPAVLNFAFEVMMDGRTFERPVNYVLVRITPPAGATVDPRKRPFVIFDPRAGQGPGIGGMKPESEIGEVLQAGHPCYFVGSRLRAACIQRLVGKRFTLRGKPRFSAEKP